MQNINKTNNQLESKAREEQIEGWSVGERNIFSLFFHFYIISFNFNYIRFEWRVYFIQFLYSNCAEAFQKIKKKTLNLNIKKNYVFLELCTILVVSKPIKMSR